MSNTFKIGDRVTAWLARDCVLGPVGHRDYWGNYVPSRDEVEPGTMGSLTYAHEHGTIGPFVDEPEHGDEEHTAP